MFLVLVCMCSMLQSTFPVWPFEKPLTSYDALYWQLVPYVVTPELKPSSNVLRTLQKYSVTRNPKLLAQLPLQLAAHVARYSMQELDVLQLLCTYVFPLNIAWEQTAYPVGIIYFHGLGDTQQNFRKYMRSLIPEAALCGIDFDDAHQNKPYNIGTGIDLLMAAHAYFLALHTQPTQVKKIFLFGFSRGGGVIARLLASMKPQFYPAGSLLVSPFINPKACHHLWQGSIPSTIIQTLPTMSHKVTPLLLLHGTADQLIPYYESKKWAQKVAATGTDVSFRAIKNKDHVGVLDAIKQLVLQFLKHNSER